MKYLWYNLNIAGQDLTCNVFHTSYNPGAGFVFLLSHPQHMVINQHYVAGNFNKSIPNLEEKKTNKSKMVLSAKLTKIGKEYTRVQLKAGTLFLLVTIIQTVLILLRKLNGLKNKAKEKKSATDFKEKLFYSQF